MYPHKWTSNKFICFSSGCHWCRERIKQNILHRPTQATTTTIIIIIIGSCDRMWQDLKELSVCCCSADVFGLMCKTWGDNQVNWTGKCGLHVWVCTVFLWDRSNVIYCRWYETLQDKDRLTAEKKAVGKRTLKATLWYPKCFATKSG